MEHCSINRSARHESPQPTKQETAGFFAKSTPECDEVVGTASGDTCFTIAQSFNLTAASFDAINPNLNCTGQWLCVAGSRQKINQEKVLGDLPKLIMNVVPKCSDFSKI
ncbi:hypothetical protein NC651_018676 [Populus alba x Populus x berolinensis]|nr:hypothetical protein NC651_018676 [Populus alba x Populus x berolinensis]